MVSEIHSMSPKINKIHARQIYDSRGKPTVEVEVTLEDGSLHRAAVPSGASTGVYEALELRDNDPKKHLGQGVEKAVRNVNEIIGPAVIKAEIPIAQQTDIDNFLIQLDGTPNKSKLGANSLLGVSMAIAVAAAYSKKIPLYRHLASIAGNQEISLPVPALNIINGGSHAGNRMPFQEFMIMPVGASSFKEAMQIGAEIYQTLKTIIKKKFGQDAINVGDEGGFAPDISSIEEGMDLVMDAIKTSGYEKSVKIAIDAAASEFHVSEKPGFYNLDQKNPATSAPRILSGQQLADMYIKLASSYPIISIEDPFDQDDFASWSYLRKHLNIQIVGDDLTVTNKSRIEMAIEQDACNALLLKVNQIGTLTESISAAHTARKAGWNIMVSHRSGETEDTFIADLVVGLNARQIKSGAPCRSERLAKYNRLLRIEDELGAEACYRSPF